LEAEEQVVPTTAEEVAVLGACWLPLIPTYRQEHRQLLSVLAVLLVSTAQAITEMLVGLVRMSPQAVGSVVAIEPVDVAVPLAAEAQVQLLSTQEEEVYLA